MSTGLFEYFQKRIWPMTIKEKISILAKENGLTLQKLEEELGFGGGTISRWEKSSPSVDKLQKVATLFGITIDELLEALYIDKEEVFEEKLMKKFIPLLQNCSLRNKKSPFWRTCWIILRKKIKS